jgi:hypothetical protein
MFTIPNKLRTIIALSAVGATLTGSGVATAATIARAPGSTGEPVVATTPTTSAPVVATTPTPSEVIDPNKVGSAGIPGWTDGMCEAAARQANWDADQEQDFADAAANSPDGSAAQKSYTNSAIQAQAGEDANLQSISDNCLVID